MTNRLKGVLNSSKLKEIEKEIQSAAERWAINQGAEGWSGESRITANVYRLLEERLTSIIIRAAGLEGFGIHSHHYNNETPLYRQLRLRVEAAALSWMNEHYQQPKLPAPEIRMLRESVQKEYINEIRKLAVKRAQECAQRDVEAIFKKITGIDFNNPHAPREDEQEEPK